MVNPQALPSDLYSKLIKGLAKNDPVTNSGATELYDAGYIGDLFVSLVKDDILNETITVGNYRCLDVSGARPGDTTPIASLKVDLGEVEFAMVGNAGSLDRAASIAALKAAMQVKVLAAAKDDSDSALSGTSVLLAAAISAVTTAKNDNTNATKRAAAKTAALAAGLPATGIYIAAFDAATADADFLAAHTDVIVTGAELGTSAFTLEQILPGVSCILTPAGQDVFKHLKAFDLIGQGVSMHVVDKLGEQLDWNATTSKWSSKAAVAADVAAGTLVTTTNAALAPAATTASNAVTAATTAGTNKTNAIAADTAIDAALAQYESNGTFLDANNGNADLRAPAATALGTALLTTEQSAITGAADDATAKNLMVGYIAAGGSVAVAVANTTTTKAAADTTSATAAQASQDAIDADDAADAAKLITATAAALSYAPDAISAVRDNAASTPAIQVSASTLETRTIDTMLQYTSTGLRTNAKNMRIVGNFDDSTIVLAARAVNGNLTVPATAADVQSDDILDVVGMISNYEYKTLAEVAGILSDEQFVRVDGAAGQIIKSGYKASTYNDWIDEIDQYLPDADTIFIGSKFKVSRATAPGGTAGQNVIFLALRFLQYLEDNNIEAPSNTQLKEMFTSSTGKFQKLNSVDVWVEESNAGVVGLKIIQARLAFDPDVFAGEFNSEGILAYLTLSGLKPTGLTVSVVNAIISGLSPDQKTNAIDQYEGTPSKNELLEIGTSAAAGTMSVDAKLSAVLGYSPSGQYNGTYTAFPTTASVADQVKIAFVNKLAAFNRGFEPLDNQKVISNFNSNFAYDRVLSNFHSSVKLFMSTTNTVVVGSYDKDGSTLSTEQRLIKIVEVVDKLDAEFNFTLLMKVKILNASLKNIGNMDATQAMAVFSLMTPDVLDRMIYEYGSTSTTLGVTTLPNNFATFITAIKTTSTTADVVNKLRITTRNLLTDFASFTGVTSLPVSGSYPSPTVTPDAVRNIVSSYLDNAGLTNTTANRKLIARLLYGLYLIGGQEGFSTMNAMPVLADGLFNGAIYYLLADTSVGFPAANAWKSGVSNTYATMSENITSGYTSIIDQRALALAPIFNNQEFNLNNMMATDTGMINSTFNSGLVILVEWLAGENNQVDVDALAVLKASGVGNEILNALARSESATESDGFTISAQASKAWYVKHR
jgi:hypothetical protein